LIPAIDARTPVRPELGVVDVKCLDAWLFAACSRSNGGAMPANCARKIAGPFILNPRAA
jgi:hypothetical protein